MCVFLAESYVAARVELGAALLHQDVAGQHALAAELLHAETASGGIAPVARAAACLLMCHGSVFLLLGRFFGGRLLGRSLLRGCLLGRRLLCMGLLLRRLALRLRGLLRPPALSCFRLLPLCPDHGSAPP